MDPTLTSKQRLFISEYLVDRNATQAAIRAGYSAKTADRQGYRLLRNAEIRAAVESSTQARTERLALSADYVLKGIRETILQARTAAQYGSALRGYELLGKHLGMFKEQATDTGEDRLDELIQAIHGDRTPPQ